MIGFNEENVDLNDNHRSLLNAKIRRKLNHKKLIDMNRRNWSQFFTWSLNLSLFLVILIYSCTYSANKVRKKKKIPVKQSEKRDQLSMSDGKNKYLGISQNICFKGLNNRRWRGRKNLKSNEEIENIPWNSLIWIFKMPCEWCLWEQPFLILLEWVLLLLGCSDVEINKILMKETNLVQDCQEGDRKDLTTEIDRRNIKRRRFSQKDSKKSN